MLATRRPFVIFWVAVLVDIVAFGIAWSTWKASHNSRFALGVAIPATIVCAAATLVAGRVLIIVTRGSR